MKTNHVANQNRVIAGQDEQAKVRANVAKSRLIRRGVWQALIAGVIVLASAQASWAQQRYPLTCRGGGYSQYEVRQNFNWNPYFQFGGGPNDVILNINKSSVASSRGLAPGMCAWADRPIAASEPSQMCFSNVPTFVQLQWNPSRREFTAQIGGSLNNTGDNANWSKAVSLSVGDTVYQTFWVYNDFNHCFRF